MARITVEDCLENVENLFALVTIASKRARRIANGAEPLVDMENDKPTVIALREIAAGLVTSDILDVHIRLHCHFQILLLLINVDPCGQHRFHLNRMLLHPPDQALRDPLWTLQLREMTNITRYHFQAKTFAEGFRAC